MSARAVGNLPAELTSFVGRRGSLMHAKNLLASARLLTCAGMGGIGKTRFAKRLASEIRRTFPDGAWLVELADLRQGALLPQSISATLGVRDESSDPVGTLLDHLRERHLLLVLDNCEHLSESCAVLIGKLLQAVPRLKIIATSRHVLGVEGEQVFPVPSLIHDSANDAPSEAMELFEERASSADPSFRITDDNRETVAAICRQLEGLPLAVELAAANVRTFSPTEILDRLQDPELLTACERTRPSRHHTLHSAIGWSYRLCTHQEQRTWEQLSVFSGGFTAQSAEAVCTTLDPDSTVMSALMGLVDKSIISRVYGTHGTKARYRMLEPVRQYAAERLASAPDADEVRRRHRDFFFQLAQRSITDYCSSRDVDWYATTRMEQANIREALDFSLSDPDEPEIAVEMATSLRPFWEQSGSTLEGYRWLRRALNRATEPSRNRAAGLVSASILGFLLEEDERARALLKEHLELTSWQGYDECAAIASFASGCEAFADADIAMALERTERAVELGLRHTDTVVVAESMALSAFAAFIIEHEHAEDIATRFLRYAESHAAHLMKAIALYPLGAVRWRRGDTASATSLMREAIRLYQLFEHPGMVAVCVEGLAWSAAKTEPDRAATLVGAAKSIWKYSQMRLPQTAVESVAATIEARLRQKLGDLGFEQALTTGQELPFDDAIALALGESAEIRPKPKDAAARAGLTRREREIAALVAEGLTNKEIATKLVISPRTADAHLEHILAKLGFRSRAQIARWFSTQEQPA